jgi:DNA adenine methylase
VALGQLALFTPPATQATRPFLKWAGGKQQLLPELSRRCPSSFRRYFEPFVGGGALFFALAPTRALLADANEDLVVTYRAVRDNVEGVIRALHKHSNTRDHFLAVRSLDPSRLSDVQRAARLIFLNRTCFNGLYRVNRMGKFNTPYGSPARVTICNKDALRSASAALWGTQLEVADFQNAVQEAGRGDFVYLDPPYIPVGKYSDFKRYHREYFGMPEHERLARLFTELDKRGCFVMLSNSHCEDSLRLYKRWNVQVVSAKRLINKDSNGRGHVNEIVVTNY